MKYKSCSFASLAVWFLGLFAVLCPSAHAAYIATLSEVGSDVVGTGGGSLDITALLFSSTGTHEALINPVFDIAAFGPTADTPTDLYRFTSGPSSFGSGFGGFPDLGGGSPVGIVSAGLQLFVPADYHSGDPLSSTDTWNNQTFASLGVTPGTYVWTWGSGEHADSFTLQIGPANVPETGSTIALMLGAVGALIAFRQKLVGQAR